MPKNTYRLADNTIVPSCTTICNQLGKGDGLMNWSHKIAYESTIKYIKKAFSEPHRVGEITIPDYKDIQRWQDVRDSAGTKGTSVHDLVAAFLGGEEIVIPENKITQNCFKKFKKWWVKETKGYEPTLIIEQQLVSEKLKFGGQPDIFMPWGRRKLIDIKTGGKWVYDDWWLQLAGYDILLRENGYKVDEYQILWLPKHNGFACPIRKNLTKEKKVFKALLEIYKLRHL